MGRIIVDIKLTGTKKSETLEALLDTGADKNYISPTLAESLGVVETIANKWDVFTGAGEIKGVHEIELVEMELLGRKIHKPRFLLCETDYPVLIGAETMQEWGIVLKMAEEKPEVTFISPKAKLSYMEEKIFYEEPKAKLKFNVRVKAHPWEWEILYKMIDEGKIKTLDQLEKIIKEKPYAIPEGYEKIPLNQVPHQSIVYVKTIPDQFWSSLNVYEDYTTKKKYLIPVYNPDNIAFKEI